MKPRRWSLLGSPTTQALFSGLALLALLGLGWMLFAPGLGGDFVFDDFPNLKGLDAINQDPGISTALRYILDGAASTVGRPVSLASFALQHDSWRANPADFIRVNILLHLLNAVLLYACLLRLLPLAGFRGRTGLVALATVALWLVSPLQAGAVLYVVQRMTLLAGTFMLFGLLLYLHGRERLIGAGVRSGLLLMTLGVGVALGPGVLSKENAVLFPLLILVAEWTVLRNLARPQTWTTWAWIFLGLPLAALAVYLLQRLPADLATTSYLGVTTPERLLSEPRILFIYLKKFLLPPLYGMRIMYDDLEVSRGLLSPWTTAAALAGGLALIVAAVATRRTAPVLAFAVFWFLGNHLLESSFIPLELAFDHRNYLAVAGVALGLCWGIDRAAGHAALHRLRPVLGLGAGLYLAFNCVALWQNASLWGKPEDLFAYWELRQPDSRRVSYELADDHMRRRRPVEAYRVWQRAFERWPGDTTIAFALMAQGCLLTGAPVPDIDQIRASFARYDGHRLTTTNLLDRVIRLMENDLCPRYPPEQLEALVELTYRTLGLRGSPNSEANYHLMLARLAYRRGAVPTALDHLDQALMAVDAPGVLALALEWSIESGDARRSERYHRMAREKAEHPPSRAWWFQ